MNNNKTKIIKLTAKLVLQNMGNVFNDIFISSQPINKKSFIDYLKRDHSEYKVRERIKYLRRWGLIEEFIKKNEKYIRISKKGKQKLLKYNIDEIKLKKFKNWNKKWQVVVFDIPESLKLKRDMLRDFLRRLGFKQYQKSIYIYPFRCVDEIKLMTEYLKIKHYVLIMISDIIEEEDKIINHFINEDILNSKHLK